MPLSSVVDYYNHWLAELHPRALLSHRARYQLDHGLLTARVAGFIVTPYQSPVIRAASGAIFGQRAKLLASTQDGRSTLPDSLYVQAWDAEDVVFLDRFLRTLHALNHLHLGHDHGETLVLDVHLRHLAAVPGHHGKIFDALLHRLGLRPEQIVLRLDGRALQMDSHLQGAARSFASRGFRLLAVRPDLNDTDWDLLRTLGVGWVSPALGDLEPWQGQESSDQWRHLAMTRRIGLWLERLDSQEALQRARDLGADLMEGHRVTASLAGLQASLKQPLGPAALTSRWAT